jgi:hypothetical protein
MKPKGKLSVREAVKRIYPDLPQRFSMIKLHTMVCREICRPYLYLDTSRRKLFELRETGDIHFKCIDKQRSLYEKEGRL